jgi:signal transduction histidine kinase
MEQPEDYIYEKRRLEELESYAILDTLPEAEYDNLTAIAAEICGTPISLISLIDEDRQWFKSHHGLNVSETSKKISFCGHTINNPDEINIVKDARLDVRFHDNPLVVNDPHVIFYAGVPLVSENGYPLGTLCVIDHKPRDLSKKQIRILKSLASHVINYLNLRKNKLMLEKSMAALRNKNIEVERFAFIAAHDLKSPLQNIFSLTDLFIEDYGSNINPDGLSILNLIKSSSKKLDSLITGLLEYSKSEDIQNTTKTKVKTDELISEITNLFSSNKNLSITYNTSIKDIAINKSAINQILINLISNAIKYNDKENIQIEITVSALKNHYEFSVKDNGPGISNENNEKVFNLFVVLESEDRFGNSGNGIGLALVKKIVEDQNGTIKLESELNKGANFIFTVSK